MNTTEIEITNINRSRSFGWGYSYTPTGNGTDIETPTRPVFSGTLNQIRHAISEDRTLQANRDCYRNSAWFYKRHRIVATYKRIFEFDYDEDGTINVCDAKSRMAWVSGFSFDCFDPENMKIRIEES